MRLGRGASIANLVSITWFIFILRRRHMSACCFTTTWPGTSIPCQYRPTPWYLVGQTYYVSMPLIPSAQTALGRGRRNCIPCTCFCGCGESSTDCYPLVVCMVGRWHHTRAFLHYEGMHDSTNSRVLIIVDTIASQYRTPGRTTPPHAHAQQTPTIQAAAESRSSSRYRSRIVV